MAGTGCGQFLGISWIKINGGAKPIPEKILPRDRRGAGIYQELATPVAAQLHRADGMLPFSHRPDAALDEGEALLAARRSVPRTQGDSGGG